MKINCHCGATVFDHGAYKAHVIPDLNWDALLDCIDRAVEGGSSASAEARCMAVRKAIGIASRPAWQCRSCGRLYFQDEGSKLHTWSPDDPGVAVRLFDEHEM
jgi:hypothetical protein